VTQQGSDAREHHGTRTVVRELSREPNSESALCRVQQQRKDAGKRTSDARNVGGTNVATARLAHISLCGYSRQN
jgi:hypothetical protein